MNSKKRTDSSGHLLSFEKIQSRIHTNPDSDSDCCNEYFPKPRSKGALIPKTQTSLNRSKSFKGIPSVKNILSVGTSPRQNSTQLHNSTSRTQLTEKPRASQRQIKMPAKIAQKVKPSAPDAIPNEQKAPAPQVSHKLPLDSKRTSHSAASTDSTELPATIRMQPIQRVFLCVNCYEYFLYPQLKAHPNICAFSEEQEIVNRKMNRVREVLEVIGGHLPNPYTVVIAKKIERYMRGQAELEDILMLQWFIVGSGCQYGLNWKELFWVIEQIGRKREKLLKQRPSLFCFFTR